MSRSTPNGAALGFYAVAMGLLEAVVVIYLRRLTGVGVSSVLAAPSGAVWEAVRALELAREAATLVMIAAVAWLAGPSIRRRVGALAFVFGLWDLSYYLFLALMVGWPSSLLDWDLLFLIPAPWWGPVLAPAAVAAVLVAGGWRQLRVSSTRPLRAWAFAVGALGAAVLVASFLASYPPHFAWAWFAAGLVLFTAALLGA